MGAVYSQLGAGEAIVHKTRLSMFSQWGKLVIAALILLLGWGEPSSVVIAGFIYGYAWLRVLTSGLAVSNKRVFATYGILSNTTMEVKLTRVEGVIVQQSILGRLLRYGNVTVAGAGNVMIPVRMAAKPVEFRNACIAAVDGDFGPLTLEEPSAPESPGSEEPEQKKTRKHRAKDTEQEPQVLPLRSETKRQRFVLPT